MDTYIRRKKDMLFRSFKSLKSVDDLILEIDKLLGIPHRKVRTSSRSEILAAVCGVGTGLTLTCILIYLSGSVLGFSPAGISSALYEAGALVGGNDTVGIFVIMMPLFILSWLGLRRAVIYRDQRLKESKIYFYKRALSKQAALKNMMQKLSLTEQEAKNEAKIALKQAEEIHQHLAQEAQGAAEKTKTTLNQDKAESLEQASSLEQEHSLKQEHPFEQEQSSSLNKTSTQKTDPALNIESKNSHTEHAQPQLDKGEEVSNALSEDLSETKAHNKPESFSEDTAKNQQLNSMQEPKEDLKDSLHMQIPNAEIAMQAEAAVMSAKAKATRERINALNELYLKLQSVIRDIKHDLGIV